MSSGINFYGIKVDNNKICDGHHRYIASMLANVSLDIIPSILSSSIITIPWIDVEFVDDDWDTLAKIKMLNEQDAKFNNIPIDKIVDILK